MGLIKSVHHSVLLMLIAKGGSNQVTHSLAQGKGGYPGGKGFYVVPYRIHVMEQFI